MLPMTKLQLMPLTLSNSAKLESNALPLLLIKQESNNSISNPCGKVPMVPLETFLMVLSSDNPSSLKIFQD